MNIKTMGIALNALTLTILSGCASITAEQCQSINPQTQGYADGQSGVTTAAMGEILSQCQSKGVFADAGAFKNDYLKAYQKGVAEYCTPANGERVGLLGKAYQGVCPKETEAPFLKEYLYALKQYRDAHPQPEVIYVPRHYDPYWDNWGYFGPRYNRGSHFRGYYRGGW